MKTRRISVSNLGIATAVFLFASACVVANALGDDILTLERNRYEDMIKADVRALDQVLGEELVFTHASGRIDTKSSLLERLASGDLDYQSIELSNVQVQSFETCAVITGSSLVNVSSGGRTFVLNFRFTSVWVQEASGWHLVAYQSTRLP